MSKLKLMTWNINGRSRSYHNYIFPSFVIDEIMNSDINADIIILTEFIRGRNWPAVSKQLSKKYWRYTYPNKTIKQNEVLIALKKDLKGFDYDSIKLTTVMNTTVQEKPNFFQVESIFNGNSLFIIGVRIKDTKNHDLEFQALNDHFSSLPDASKIICAGDFNEWPSHVKKNLNNIEIYSPRFNDNHSNINPMYRNPSRWSYVTGNSQSPGKAVIDLIATKNVTILRESTDSKSILNNYKMLANYIWDFVTPNNGYGSLKPEDYKSHLAGLPDHAILTASIKT
ncbi:endonuclease/exonuclease/phosphatase family protein [Fusibacter sp. 3D3]|uniref:endonuclease/exonuclease/phosphatase family protein n=1 Tax=Fusibacter sp. 3D3 TaxID=1048380 RepID=UPI00085365F4|nr:endonuclease/exonuclease/phosphatase family protein [Fusibacter sp. 3D3]GAU79576.1 hypothetical protein F3D3_4240 [Fusibacter sp. 3D3]